MKIKKVSCWAVILPLSLFFGCGLQNKQIQGDTVFDTIYEDVKIPQKGTAFKGQSVSPDDPNYKVDEQASLDFEKNGDNYYRQGRYEMAFVEYDKACLTNPRNANAHLKKGLLFNSRDLWSDAEKEFLNVVEIKPDNAMAHQELGKIYFRQNKYPQAEEHLKKATESDNQLWEAYNFLGIVYNHAQKYKDAVTQFTAAAKIKPQSAFIYNNLGIAYSMLGYYDLAITAFQMGLRNPTIPDELYNNYGMVLAKVGRYDEALDSFMKSGDTAKAYNNMGCIYLFKGNKKKAEEYFEKAIEISPSFYSKANENLAKSRRESQK